MRFREKVETSFVLGVVIIAFFYIGELSGATDGWVQDMASIIHAVVYGR